MRRLLFDRDPRVNTLQNQFWGLGPGGLQVTCVGVTVAAFFASTSGRMSFDVLAQVVAPHKALVAHRARKSFFPCVGTKVPLKLVRSGEAFPAKKPVAHEGPFSGVPSEVRFEVRCFAVHFATAWNVATVESFSTQTGTGRPKPFCLLAVRAVTRRPARVSPGGSRRAPDSRTGT